MEKVAGVSALSGGAWFLSHLAYSSRFNERFDTTAERNTYASNGYLSAVEDFVRQVDSVEVSSVTNPIKDAFAFLTEEVSRRAREINDISANRNRFIRDGLGVYQTALDGFRSLLSLAGNVAPQDSVADAQPLLNAAQRAIDAASAFNRAEERDRAAALDNYVDALRGLNGVVGRGIDSINNSPAADTLNFFIKTFKFITQDAALDWRKIVDGLVNQPLGIAQELANTTLASPRLPWAAGKDLVISAALTTSKSPILAQPTAFTAFGEFFRILAHANPDPVASAGTSTNARPISISSLANGSSLTGLVDVPGSELRIDYGHDITATGPDPRTVRPGNIFDASSLKLTDAAVASSSALALLAQPKVLVDIAFWSKVANFILPPPLKFLGKDLRDDPSSPTRTPFLTPWTAVEDIFAQDFRNLAPLASLKDGTFAMPAAPSDLAFGADFAGPFRRAVDNVQVRLMDGGYSEDSSAADMLRHLQKKSGPLASLDMTLFINSSGNFEENSVAVNGGAFRIINKLACLFGMFQGSSPAQTVLKQPGELDDGPFPGLEEKRAVPQLFRADAWQSESGPEWQSILGDLSVQYYDLTVTTVRNDQLGIKGGQTGRLRVFASNNADSFALALKPDDLANYGQNYNGARSAIASEGGDYLLFSALGLLPLISFGGTEMQVVGNDVAGSLTGRDNTRDTLYGGDNNDTLRGMGQSDSLVGGAGKDSLDGGSGDDFLDGGTGIDTMTGGAGNDTYVVDNASDRLTPEAANNGTDTVRSSLMHVLGDNFEQLVLTGTAAISGTGNAANNTLSGNAGSNTLSGLGGDDFLDGGSGNDSLIGGAGNDTYVLDIAGDRINETGVDTGDAVHAPLDLDLGSLASGRIEHARLLGAASLRVTGNAANNTLSGNAGSNTLSGLGGDDFLDGGSGNDSLIGGAGNDTLDGNSGADRMAGGEGNDAYIVDHADDSIQDFVFVVPDFPVQTPGQLPGGPRPQPEGGLQNAGVDTVTSVGLNDYRLGAFLENLILSPTTVARLVTNPVTGQSQKRNLAALNGTGNSLDNVIAGNGEANSLAGLGGNDTLSGGAGNDVLDGGLGADFFVGGLGNDTFVVDDAGDKIAEEADAGTDTVISTVSREMRANLENLTLTGTKALKGIGNASSNRIIGNVAVNMLSGDLGNDSLDGGGGNDSLDGGAGNDVLDGGLGADFFVGGLGNDTFYVDNAGDKIAEEADAGTDTVISTVSREMRANLENLTLTGTRALKGIGNASSNRIIGNGKANRLSGRGGNDMLSGGAGNDTLDGGDGNDRLDGGLGADFFVGGLGNDTFFVDNSGDKIAEEANGGVDTVISSVSRQMRANLENLTLIGIGPLEARGNDLANRILGNSGGNNIIGGRGNDSISGGFGNDTLSGCIPGANQGRGEIDTLTGGAGKDLFKVGWNSGLLYDDGNRNSPGLNDYVLITDFTVGTDRLELDGRSRDYLTGRSPVVGVEGAGLFHDSNGDFKLDANDELLAIVRTNNSVPLRIDAATARFI